jgi:hypothetical protein
VEERFAPAPAAAKEVAADAIALLAKVGVMEGRERETCGVVILVEEGWGVGREAWKVREEGGL